MGGWFVDLYFTYLLKSLCRVLRMRRSRVWPTVTGRVASTRWSPGEVGCPMAEVVYTYTVGDNTFGGIDEKPFLSSDSAESHTLRFTRDSSVVVRFKPEDPSVSVVRDRDQTPQGRVALVSLR